MQAATLISAEEFDLLAGTDERRLEFMDGEICEMSSPRPVHNYIVRNLFRQLDRTSHTAKLGLVLWGNEFKIGAAYRFIPDLAFLSVEKAQFLDPGRTPIDLIPELAIEVASPTETVAQMDRKITAYLEAGVSEVWVVIPETEHIYVYTSDGTCTLNNSKTLSSPLFPNWSMPVSAVFDLGL